MIALKSDSTLSTILACEIVTSEHKSAKSAPFIGRHIKLSAVSAWFILIPVNDSPISNQPLRLHRINDALGCPLGKLKPCVGPLAVEAFNFATVVSLPGTFKQHGPDGYDGGQVLLRSPCYHGKFGVCGGPYEPFQPFHDFPPRLAASSLWLRLSAIGLTS